MLRRTKIVATLGPATDAPEALAAIIRAGVDVVRLNFSHGSAEEHIERARRVREAAAAQGRFVALLADLPGAQAENCPVRQQQGHTHRRPALRAGRGPWTKKPAPRSGLASTTSS